MRYALSSLAMLVAIALCAVFSLANYQLRQVATMEQPPANLDDYAMLKLVGGNLLMKPVAAGAVASSPAEIAKQISRRCMIGFLVGIVIGAVGFTLVLLPGGEKRSED